MSVDVVGQPGQSEPQEPEPTAGTASERRATKLPVWLPLALVILAGAILFLPAIRSPRFLDDYFQTSMIDGTYPSPRSAWNLYDFVGDADRAVLFDRGLLPWWSHPRITVRFLRPLSSLLLSLDHRLFGIAPLPAHLHSFAWWALASWAAWTLYRRALPAKAAVLGTAIFALASCHAMPLVWLAHREVLVSVAFGVLGLGALVRLSERGGARDFLAATLFFSGSLLGGEYGISFGGYALALALASGQVPWRRRLLALASFGVPALAYLFVRAKLGYGAEGSGLYYDPFRDPGVFLAHAPRRLVTLLGEGWLTLDPDTLDTTTPAWILVLVVLASVGAFTVPLRRAMARLDDQQRDHAKWLLVGSVLALLPMLSVSPAPRLLAASLVGVAATVGIILERAWFPPAVDARRGASELAGAVALLLGYAHLVHSPVTAWITTKNLRIEGRAFLEHADELKARVAEGNAHEIVLVRGLSGSVFVLPYALDDHGTPPARWRILGLVGHVLVLRRDARTIEVVAGRNRGLFPIGEGNLFRGEGRPLHVGDVVDMPGMRVTVLDVGEAGPRRARFEFDSAVDAPGRIWVNDRFDGLYETEPPEVGFGKPFEPLPPAEDDHPE